MNLQQRYRDEAYRLKAHPHSQASEPSFDNRDSFVRVYLSIVPFLVAEYFIELKFAASVSGLVFPMGFLLFWAFYYTYYRPGVLEARLSDTREFESSDVVKLFVGVLIWFVKVSCVEVLRVVARWFFEQVPEKKKRRVVISNLKAPPRAREPMSAKTPPGPPPLPKKYQDALNELGISRSRSWTEIHHRYRELAKRYHPDLNPELTGAGTRFMRVDTAYKVLEAVKDQYFPNPKS